MNELASMNVDVVGSVVIEADCSFSFVYLVLVRPNMFHSTELHFL